MAFDSMFEMEWTFPTNASWYFSWSLKPISRDLTIEQANHICYDEDRWTRIHITFWVIAFTQVLDILNCIREEQYRADSQNMLEWEHDTFCHVSFSSPRYGIACAGWLSIRIPWNWPTGSDNISILFWCIDNLIVTPRISFSFISPPLF
jgi:hypothetical protein